MLSSKSPKKNNKPVEVAAAPLGEQIIPDSKPAKRTTSSAAKTTTPNPTQASHRHSKITVPASPVIEEVVAEVVVTPAQAINKEEVARLAYTFWEERNFSHGSAEEDWHRAVKTLAATA